MRKGKEKGERGNGEKRKGKGIGERERRKGNGTVKGGGKGERRKEKGEIAQFRLVFPDELCSSQLAVCIFAQSELRHLQHSAQFVCVCGCVCVGNI